MKIIFLFLLFSLNGILFAQIPSLNATIQDVQNRKHGYVFDSSTCEKNYKIALKDIDRKNLEYSIYSKYGEDTLALRFQKTEWLWVRENTPFVQTREWH